MEIVENYLRKEYETLKQDKEEVESTKLKFKFFEQSERNLQHEKQVFSMNKITLEKEKQQLIQEVNFIKEYNY